jgi:hypothetical protein
MPIEWHCQKLIFEKMQNAKNEVFEPNMSDVWMKKWALCGCSIFELNKQVLKRF